MQGSIWMELITYMNYQGLYGDFDLKGQSQQVKGQIFKILQMS